MKKYSLSEAEDLLIGKRGTKVREAYEIQLKLGMMGDLIRNVREKKNMTQAELGEKIGVRKAQISRLENSNGNMRLDTILKIFDALEAQVNFSVSI